MRVLSQKIDKNDIDVDDDVVDKDFVIRRIKLFKLNDEFTK